MNSKIIFYVLLNNIRSSHNVGSIFRTSDAFGVSKVILTGFTPYPTLGEKDKRRAGIKEKVTKDIAKTALGAQNSVLFEYRKNALLKIKQLKKEGFKIIALENNIEEKRKITKLSEIKLTKKICLILGAEVGGVEKNILKLADQIVEIPMYGKKESLNVSVAFGVACYKISEEKNRLKN